MPTSDWIVVDNEDYYKRSFTTYYDDTFALPLIKNRMVEWLYKRKASIVIYEGRYVVFVGYELQPQLGFYKTYHEALYKAIMSAAKAMKKK